MEMKKNKKTGSRDWLMFDKENHEYKIFSPLSPLSHHAAENEDLERIIRKGIRERKLIAENILNKEENFLQNKI